MDPFRKEDDRHLPRKRAYDLFEPHTGCRDEVAVRQQSTEAVENLNRVSPGINLELEKTGDRCREFFKELRKELRLAIKHGLGLRILFNPAAFDHEIRQSPGRACKTQHS